MTTAATLRSAVITGAANGIGRSVAKRLALTGYRVLLVDRDETALTDLTNELTNAGATAQGYPADVSSSADVQGYVAKAHELHGAIDAFVNNAGIIGRFAPLVDYPEDTFDQVCAVNLRGVFLGLKYVLPGMYQRGSGSVVNTASVAGQVGHLQHAGYVASKHAVVGLTKVAGAESAPHGVRVNAVAPGPVRTEMIEAIEAMKNPDDAETERQRLLTNIPAHRYGTVDEVAGAVCFLLGDESAYINGSVLTIDGGFTAIR